MRQFIKRVISGATGVQELRRVIENEQEIIQQLRSEIGNLRASMSGIPEIARKNALALTLQEDITRDLIALLLGAKPVIADDIEIRTDHSVAITSDDHRFPRGTGSDNTRHPRFVTACEQAFGRKVQHLDLGCAGGGLVWDFLIGGHFSVGIEGSDYSKLDRRAEWRSIPTHLFTADITQPFHLSRRGEPLLFDVITAWEVLKHIPEPLLSGLLRNISHHLAPAGLFVASVASFEDRDPKTGAVWHVTLQPERWWKEKLKMAGLVPHPNPFRHRDHVRGSGNPRAVWDWDGEVNHEMGFHLVMGKET